MDPVGSARKTLSLHCSVWGVFADLGVPPVKAALDIELRDSICWVPQSFAGQALEDAAAMSQPQCRSRCRASKSCSHFLWSPTEKTCWRYRLDALGPEVTAFAKVTSCTEGITCLDVKHDAWYLAGQYCPLGQDSWRGGVVYRKAGATVQDSSFLSAYHSAAVDGEVKTLDGSSCREGDWILRAQAPGHDFVDVKSGRFALRGEAQSCVSEPQGNVTWAVNDCAAPNLGPGQEGGLQALVVDDPNTVPAEDFWLHPCDCVPPAWGAGAPMSQVSFDEVPVGSNNSFVPKPFSIVQGQFSCPSRQLLPGKAGLHYETETEAFEASACESRCRVQESCRFFFQGTQHGTKTCRLFSDCDSLVREFSLSGKLMAMPRQASCQVSDPEACWATTMRRSFLSSSAFSFSSQSEKQSPSDRALPPKPADPPAEGMVAWFKSQNAGSTWPSSVGEFVGTAGQRGVIRELGAGYGADQPVTYINGGTNSDFDFGKVLKSTFSICSVSRYTGGAVKEILGGGSRQMSHGHWGGQAGVAYYQEWVTPSSNKGPSMDWLVFCGTNGDQQVYDGMKNIATKAAKKGGNQNLKANGCASSGNSDFAVMEVITWDRALSQKEFETATQYLQWRLRVGAQVETSEHLATLWENNFKPEKEVSDVSNTEFVHDLSNGYKATLTGWTHTRFYADGFVRNIAGSGTAVIDGLTPGAPYLYHVYQRSTFTSQQVQHQLSVNHGPAFNTFQNEVDSPSASGLVVATPRGEIRFEFIRIGGQVHLSGIALALAGDEAALVQSDASSKARSLGSAAARESGFRHLHLYQQCDTAKLLGGLGVEACARPAHREPASHSWQHKRPLPKTFGHGSQLLLSCWEERFAGLQGSEQEGRSEQLACVNGEWFNSQDQPQLGDFTCQACVQVAGPGYAAYDQRNEQELYHFNRMKLSIFSELGMVAELSKHPKNTYCLQQAAAGVSSSAMSVVASTSCPAVLVAQVTSESEPESRVVRLLGEGEATAWQCLAGVSTPEGSATLEHTACNTSDRSQLVNPGELAMSMWTLLVESSREQHGLQGAYAAYCGKQAALNNLNFGQVFAGNTINSSTTCKFAPLIQFGEFVDSGISRDKANADWPDWWHLLADNPVICGTGEALTGIRLEASLKTYKRECSKIGGLGACMEYYSAQVEVNGFAASKANWERTMMMLEADCGENALLSGFHFEFSQGGKWARVRYTCCKAGGAPVVIEARGLEQSLVSDFDKIFCPHGKDVSGRLTYLSSSGEALAFNHQIGRWCIGGKCSEVGAGVTPLGLSGPNFDVVAVSDFVGEFGIPVPKSGEDRAMKAPERTGAPEFPKLETFNAEQPTYSAECLDYKDLWNRVSETFKNDAGETITEESKLNADPSTVGTELPDYHPCQVARSAGGIFGELGKGDGSKAVENMMYSDWNKCMQGDIERDLADATLEWHAAINDAVSHVVERTQDVYCDTVPDVVTAPLGAGFSSSPSDLCADTGKLAQTMLALDGPFSKLGLATRHFQIQEEGHEACNPLQVGFARAFCDIHCVRDAVIRGDRGIIRNLEHATRKTNKNMEKMMKWSVDANRVETGWLGDKIDYSDGVSTKYLQEILQNLNGEKAQLLQGARVATESMLAELSGFAKAASFNELSRVTAQSALERFLGSADLDARGPNATQAAAVLGQLDSLHQTLRRAAGKAQKSEVVGRQLAGEIRNLQQQARLQSNMLGVYRQLSNVSRGLAVRHSSGEQRAALLSLDRIWWQLRDRLDEYLDQAEEEVESFQASFDEFTAYEHCSAGFSSLISTYTRSMAVMERSHRLLRATWRETSNLLGELASVIVDGEAFPTFVRAEGCGSSLLKQTMQQARSAVGGMKMLLHRFKVSGLAAPDNSAVLQAVKRIQEARNSAVKGCPGNSA
ncbi:unnamed protein product [Polarella glacialis]|uniref:Uncharacterized protein n=1 Tax=Polarella glacialis TaxID=89957 RepID=A0A813FR25_POLGL|nr:unnamed protein product [Polarella glacialis]